LTTRNIAKLLAAVLCAGLPATLLANGMRLASQDGFATARGEAFVATADNPSAIYYNPAGITQLEGVNVRGGAYGIYLNNSFKPPAGQANSGQDYHDSDHLAAAPQFFATYTLQSAPVSLGLGIYAPYGASVSWPQDTGFRTIGTRASLTYVRINPVFALKLPGNISLAAGAMVDYGRIDLEQGLERVPNARFPDYFIFKGSGWAAGYNLGLLWQPHEMVSLGASFRSMTSLSFNGSTEFADFPLPAAQLPATLGFRFPWTAVAGVSFRPTPKWNIEADADYTDWSSLGVVTLQQKGSAPPGYSQSVDFPSNIQLNWRASWMYEFGVTRYLDGGWHVSAGCVFSQNSVPQAYYTPLVPDMDRYFVSAGAGWKGKRFNFDIAYQLGYGTPHTVAGSAAPSSPGVDAGQTADGQYNFISHAVLLSAGMHF
jgi:long-chain fatty acid transport protein